MVSGIFPDKQPIDFSFIPSLQCNLSCPFCMYDCSLEKIDELDFEKTKSFLKTVDWGMINSCGFYGGEVSINLELYQKFIDLVPDAIPKFTISNGAWSREPEMFSRFLNFLNRNELFLVVSGTEFHKRHQNLEVLKILKDECSDGIRLKDGDEIHPMGRARLDKWSCSNKCQTHTNPIRLGLFPDGNILFQNCDGSYPIIQTYNQPFEGIIDRVLQITWECSRQEVHTDQYCKML
ncbi:hypothetical protein C4588_06085 [Candidatus Parcubacteria bacterium]|nr:MAG: hypothetical protein C4588_06085 [Candidatus Parcubacteria bacterium]